MYSRLSEGEETSYALCIDDVVRCEYWNDPGAFKACGAQELAILSLSTFLNGPFGNLFLLTRWPTHNRSMIRSWDASPFSKSEGVLDTSSVVYLISYFAATKLLP